MKEKVTFKLPVYRDQLTNSTYIGQKVQVGDTVRLIIRNDGGPQTTQDVVLTAVLEGAKTIEWDNGTTGNLRTEDIVRVHQRHQYACPVPGPYTAILTELNPGTVPMGITSITLSGATYAIGTVETAAANAIQPAFAQATVDKINSILGDNGFASYVIAGSAGTQTLTITIRDLTLVWTAIAVTGATITQAPTYSGP